MKLELLRMKVWSIGFTYFFKGLYRDKEYGSRYHKFSIGRGKRDRIIALYSHDYAWTDSDGKPYPLFYIGELNMLYIHKLCICIKRNPRKIRRRSFKFGFQN